MRDYNLGFISNEDLYKHVKETVDNYRFEIDLKSFNKNLVDPIKLTFDSKVYRKEMRDVIESEVIRQRDKTNSNLIGYFNQNIFRYIGEGWTVPKTGYDIINLDKHYYVEMKNKHNTMNSSSSQKTFMRMQNTRLKDENATCMLVEVIAKHSQNIEWKLSLDGVPTSHESILRVSIDKFYELVTGEKLAFKKLCEQIPHVIDDIVSEMPLGNESNTVVSELEEKSPNLIKSIYLLSFEAYDGFEHFEI